MSGYVLWTCGPIVYVVPLSAHLFDGASEVGLNGKCSVGAAYDSAVCRIHLTLKVCLQCQRAFRHLVFPPCGIWQPGNVPLN